MYLSAQRVRSPSTGQHGVNLFAYLHGPPVAGQLPLPEQNPGTLVWFDTSQLAPPGNDVLSYLDVVTYDGLPLDEIRQYLAALKHTMVPGGNPTVMQWGPLWIRYGLVLPGIPWSTELGALAGHLVMRLPPGLG